MAISEARKKQLLELIPQLKAGGAVNKISPNIVAGEAGITGPVTKTTAGQVSGEAIRRAKPEVIQEQEERVRSRGIFGDSFKGFREIPKRRTETGGIATEFEEEPSIVAGRETAAKLAEGERAAARSLAVVSTTLNDFSKIIVGAFDEGGFGDIIKAGKTALKQRFAGGLATEELVDTSKIPGKKVEIITKMMPLLTQQGDKPGSVRLVSTVFERLSDSLPGANKRGDFRGNDISLQEARGMMSETIKSMLRFAQAINSLDITNESVEQVQGKLGPDGKPEKGSELSKLGDLIESVSQQFFQEGSPEEQQIEQFISIALKPLDDRIAALGTEDVEGREGDFTLGLTAEEQEELRQIDAELKGL